MGAEAIIVPIILDPKQGLASLKALGEEAKKTNQHFDGTTGSGNKFASTMKNIASNALQVFGAMNLLQGVTKIVTESFIQAISGTNKLASATKILADSQRAAVASTRSEVVELQTLFAVAKDTSLTYSQRQAAIDKLNKSYPELHKNLSLENIGTREVANAIQSVIDNLVKKAQLQGLITTIAGLSNAAAEAREMAERAGRGAIRNDLISYAEKAERRIKSLTDEAIKLQAAVSGGAISLGKAGLSLGGSITAPPPAAVSTKQLNIKPAKLVIEKPNVVDFLQGGPVGDRSDFLYKLLGIDKGGMAAFLQQEMQEAANKRPLNLFENLADTNGKGFTAQLEKGNKLYEEMIANSERLTNRITGLLTPAFDSFIEAVVNKQDALQAFFSAIGQSIKQLVKQLVQAALQAAVLSLITGGASKGGLSFGKAFGKIFGFAEGGLVTSPVSALIGEGKTTNANNPEVVAPLDKLKKFFTNISGNNRGYAAGSNMGMAASFINMPKEVIIRGSGRDFYGVLELERLSQNSNG